LRLKFNDGRVDPEKRTIKEMRLQFDNARKRPRPPEDKDFLLVSTIQPPAPLNGLDITDGNWLMLPLPGPAKIVRIENFNPLTDDITVANTNIASHVSTGGEIIGLMGHSPGTTTLTVDRVGQTEPVLTLELEV